MKIGLIIGIVFFLLFIPLVNADCYVWVIGNTCEESPAFWDTTTKPVDFMLGDERWNEILSIKPQEDIITECYDHIIVGNHHTMYCSKISNSDKELSFTTFFKNKITNYTITEMKPQQITKQIKDQEDTLEIFSKNQIVDNEEIKYKTIKYNEIVKQKLPLKNNELLNDKLQTDIKLDKNQKVIYFLEWDDNSPIQQSQSLFKKSENSFTQIFPERFIYSNEWSINPTEVYNYSTANWGGSFWQTELDNSNNLTLEVSSGGLLTTFTQTFADDDSSAGGYAIPFTPTQTGILNTLELEVGERNPNADVSYVEIWGDAGGADTGKPNIANRLGMCEYGDLASGYAFQNCTSWNQTVSLTAGTIYHAVFYGVNIENRATLKLEAIGTYGINDSKNCATGTYRIECAPADWAPNGGYDLMSTIHVYIDGPSMYQTEGNWTSDGYCPNIGITRKYNFTEFRADISGDTIDTDIQFEARTSDDNSTWGDWYPVIEDTLLTDFIDKKCIQTRANFTTTNTSETARLIQIEWDYDFSNIVPSLDNAILNSTSRFNITDDNLTLSIDGPQDPDGDSYTNITDWRRNGVSWAVLNMPFDTNNEGCGGNCILDYTTNNNNGHLNNGIIWNNSGIIGGAYEFNSLTSYIIIEDQTHTSLRNIFNNNGTITSWIRPNDDGELDEGQIVTKRNPLSGWRWYTSNQNGDFVKLTFQRDFDSNDGYWRTVNTIIPIEQWSFITLLYNDNSDANDPKMYLNGEEIILTEFSIPSGTAIDDTNQNFSIGSNGVGTKTFNGTIDEVMIFNTSLSEQQIQDIYQAGLDGHHLNQINSEETTAGEIWDVAVTPNDGLGDGTTIYSGNLTIAGTYPSPVTTINSTDSTLNRTTQDILCAFSTEITGTANVTWWINDIYNLTMDNISVNADTTYIETLPASNTHRLDNIFCEVTIKNGGLSTDLVNSSTIIIENTSPTIPAIDIPENNTLSENITNNISCYGSTDIDLDPIQYTFFGDQSNPPTTLLQNTTDQSYQWTGLAYGDHWWNCKADDGITPSALNNTRRLYIDSRDIIVEDYSYPNSVLEGSINLFESNLTINSLLVSNVNASIIYNQTVYSVNKRIINSTYTNFYTEIVSPTIDGDEVIKNFTWNYTLTLLNQTIRFNESQILNHTVGKTTFFDCSTDPVQNETQALTLNITFWDEINKDFVLNESLKAYLTTWSGDGAENRTTFINIGNASKTHEVDICIKPSNVSLVSDALFEYVTDDYPTRFYFFDNKTLSNTTTNLRLYSLENSESSETTVYVQDEVDEGVPNAYVKVQRLDVATNDYYTVAMLRTDNDGKDVLELQKGETWYRFIVRLEDFGEDSLTSEQTKIASTETAIYLSLTPSTVGELISGLIDGFFNLSWNNNTNIFSALYSGFDSSKVSLFCLDVSKKGNLEEEELCHTCSTLTSNELICNVGNSTGTYVAVFYDKINPERILSTLIESVQNEIFADTLGVDGLLVTALLALVLFFAGLSNDLPTAILLSSLSPVICGILGLIHLGYGSIVTLIIFGGLIIYKLKA